MIRLPEAVREITERLMEAGYSAYAVGGCVRDSLLGRTPHDWDICTSAKPDQVKKCLAGRRILDTGIQHGTVTAMIDGTPYEITSFRTDGDYADHRRPKSVTFVESLKEDLSRRDFTINAMAYNNCEGLRDFFGGREDLGKRLLRTVGNPDRRFQEDALRLLRAVRFASIYHLEIAPETETAIHRNLRLLDHIAKERISEEICKLLPGQGADKILLRYTDLFQTVIPELAALDGCPQNGGNVWQHTVRAVREAPTDPLLRLTILLHDIGIPVCRERGEPETAHAKRGAELSERILRRLRMDNSTIQTVRILVELHHEEILPQPAHLKQWLNRIGEERLRQLIAVKRSDISGQTDPPQEQLKELERAEEQLTAILEQGQCYSLKDLAVSGSDLILAGIPEGAMVGKILRELLEQVMTGALPNMKSVLLSHLPQASYPADQQKRQP